MSATAELLPGPRGLPAFELALVPLIGLPPVEVLPESVRPAFERYAEEVSPAGRAALVLAVDQIGHGWEHQLASRAVEARAELEEACRRAAELHDELVTLRAAAAWLRSFPWNSSWEPERYTLHLVAGEALAVPEVLGAIEDACVLDERLEAIACQRAPHDEPYRPFVVRKGRPGSAAQAALAEAGVMLSEIAELIGASVSAVSLWLAGRRAYPGELLAVLDQLVDVETAARVISLIPAR